VYNGISSYVSEQVPSISENNEEALDDPVNIDDLRTIGDFFDKEGTSLDKRIFSILNRLVPCNDTSWIYTPRRPELVFDTVTSRFAMARKFSSYSAEFDTRRCY
jgi:hypothetical protein